MRKSRISWLLLFVSSPGWTQTDGAVQAILERLDRLEQQNRALTEEVQALRRQLAAQGVPTSPTPVEAAPIEERLEVQERRTEELAQSKVQASQRLPVSLTGMLLFNAFLNGRFNGAQDNPTTASLNAVPRTGGGTFRQTILGLRFQSPQTVLGAGVNGSLYMDFFSNLSGAASPNRAISGNLNRLMRLRIATVELDWGSTALLFGQDKPIISPREPTSLAHVGVSPLTNAGNPWLWQPQARLEQRIRLNDRTDVRAQIGIFQTAEAGQNVPEAIAATLESSRPGFEGRFAFRYAIGEDRHIEFAPGMHASATHVAGTSVPSRVYSIDWSIAALPKLDFTGMFYGGQNTANLGTIRPGFTVLGPGQVIPTHSLGGWAQVSYTATPRLTFNIFGGQHDDRDRDLRLGGIGKNFAYAGNALYRVAPNVILGFETMQIRTHYIGTGRRLNNHYDLALAYQF
jgi:hypothetical protein